jgi:hypothetical protein
MAYDTLSPYAGAYPQTKEEIPTPEATAKAMRQAGRDLGVGSLRFGTFMAMAPEIDWLANKMALNVGYPMMMADPAYQSFPQKEKEAFHKKWLAAQGKRGDEQHQEWAKGQLNKYHGMDFWEWSEQIPELLDEIIPLETTEGSKAVENIEMLLTLGWGLAGIAQLLKLAATKGPAWLRKKLKSIVKNKQGEEILDDIVPEDIVPEAPLQIERKMTLDEFRNNMKEQGITPEWMEGLQKDIAHADETIAMVEDYYRTGRVPPNLFDDSRTPLQIEHKPPSETRIDKTVERATAEKTPLQRSGDLMNQFLEEAGIASDIKISSTGSITTPKTKPKTVERVTKEDLSLKTTIDATPGGPDYTKSGALRKTPASEVDTEQLLKRMNNRTKKRVAEGNREVAKIKKEYADMGIEEFTENGKMFVTKPDGMTNEEALKKASEMYKRQNAVRDKIRKKWDNLDIEKDEAAAYKRAYKYWEDRFEKAADFQPSDKLNKALFKDHPEIWTQQKREALAVRHINSPEARAIEKELKEAKKRVGERFKAREIGEVEMYKQGALLREKANKKLEELLLDQIKSEVELAVKSDPFKEFEDMVLKKGDYKDITLHSRGGLVENKVNYALNQWK